MTFLQNIFNFFRGKKKQHPATDAAEAHEADSWKVDWIDEEGVKGTYETHETDIKEAEWKFQFLYDETRKIIKMHKGPPLK